MLLLEEDPVLRLGDEAANAEHERIPRDMLVVVDRRSVEELEAVDWVEERQGLFFGGDEAHKIIIRFQRVLWRAWSCSLE